MMGRITAIKGIIVRANGLSGRMYETVRIGDEGYGEIIDILGNGLYSIQLFTNPEGMAVGDRVEEIGKPITVEVGPHLLGHFFDGLEMSLEEGPFYRASIGNRLGAKFEFRPSVKKGDTLRPGQAIGPADGGAVLAPPDVSGTVKDVLEGKFTIYEPVCHVGGRAVAMSHEWPIRKPRPFAKRIFGNELMATGQRVIDTFLPVKKGGTTTIPGGFGSGKTTFQHNFAEYADADTKVFVGCGERGNEMADFIGAMRETRKMGSTTVIANTSNMPIIARESSIYAGATMAEYLRDTGKSVLLMVDSLSRWAEALREVGGIMEVIPAEEGYPPYLQERITEFFSRSGCVETLGGKKGCLTMIASVSPPSGDFSEPITQYAASSAGVAIFMSSDLAHARVFPAVDLKVSFSKYFTTLVGGWEDVRRKAGANIKALRSLVEKGFEIEEIEKIVGYEALSPEQKITLRMTRIIRRDFLVQNAFDENDAYCSRVKTTAMLEAIAIYYSMVTRIYRKGGQIKFDKDAEALIGKMKASDEKGAEGALQEIKNRLAYV